MQKSARKIQGFMKMIWLRCILREVKASVKKIQNMYLRWSIRRDKISERWEDFQKSHLTPHNDQVKRDYQKLFGICEDNMDWDQIQDEIYYRDNKLALTIQSEDFEFSMDSNALDFNNVRLLGQEDEQEEVDIINQYSQQEAQQGEEGEMVFQSLLQVG